MRDNIIGNVIFSFYIMPKKFVLVILHRELRLQNNPAILHGYKIAVARGLKLIICFRFDFRQISPEQNPYFGINSFIFMLQCLRELADVVHLIPPNRSLPFKDSAVIVTTADYTPFARARLNEYRSHGIPVITLHQHIVSHPDLIRTRAGGVFEMNFAQFASAADKKMSDENMNNRISPKFVKPNKKKNLQLLATLEKKHINDFSADLLGGRKSALKTIAAVTKWKNGYYGKIRNVLSNNTTRLSPYMKFGCLGLGELFYSFKLDPEILRQFLWRSYYYYLSYHFPHEVWDLGRFPGALKKTWTGEADLQKMLCAKSGVPLIDAGIIQLKTTGFVHNRVRMVTADYCKRKNINWKKMEMVYANYLTDYDPAVNRLNWMYMNGQWHWQFRTRYFNPELQVKKYDPEHKYLATHLGRRDTPHNK